MVLLQLHGAGKAKFGRLLTAEEAAGIAVRTAAAGEDGVRRRGRFHLPM